MEPKKKEISKIEKVIEEKIKEAFELKKEKKTEFLKEEEKALKEEILREVEKMELEPKLKKQALKEAEKIEKFENLKKVKMLFDFAEKKGLSYAIEVAKSLKDHFLIDVFHDLLVKDEFYKKFKI